MVYSGFLVACREKSKQLAEQAAAIAGLIVLGLEDCRKPGTDNPNDEVAHVWRQEFTDQAAGGRHKTGTDRITEAGTCSSAVVIAKTGVQHEACSSTDVIDETCGGGDVANCDKTVSLDTSVTKVTLNGNEKEKEQTADS